MHFKIEVMDEEGIGKLKFSGASDSEEHKRARDNAVDLCREREFFKVLVDMTEQESFMSGATLELYEFGKEFANGLFSKGTRLAVVNENGPKPDVRFVVNVAQNRGFLTQLYNETSEALGWLLS